MEVGAKVSVSYMGVSVGVDVSVASDNKKKVQMSNQKISIEYAGTNFNANDVKVAATIEEGYNIIQKFN